MSEYAIVRADFERIGRRYPNVRLSLTLQSARLLPSPRSFGTSLRNELDSGALPGEVVSEHDSKQV